MFRENDKVKIIKTGETGYVEKVLEQGERLMVRIPSSSEWPYPHHVYVVKENVHRVTKGNPSSEEPLF